MKKGFTLVELLVVVAILGILAAVGIVSFGGFTGSAKENATKTNHKNVVSFISASILQCSFQETIRLNTEQGDPYDYFCNDHLGKSKNKYGLRDSFIEHLRNAGFKNPYDSVTHNGRAIDNGSHCEKKILGNTDINFTYQGNTVSGLVIESYYKDGESCLVDKITIE